MNHSVSLQTHPPLNPGLIVPTFPLGQTHPAGPIAELDVWTQNCLE
jgi:hypothetical protein